MMSLKWRIYGHKDLAVRLAKLFIFALLCLFAFGTAQASWAGSVHDVKIGVIGAMDVEVDMLKEALNISRVISRAGMDFLEGRLNDKDVVVVKCGMGKVNAAVCAQILIDEFHVTHVINTGVAGALNNNLKIGDIVIGVDAVQHDYDVSPISFKKGEIPYTGLVAFPLDDTLRRRLARAVMDVAPNVKAIEGRICTGDQFIATAAQKDAITSNFGGDCCEMEGAAIAQVCYLNNIPCAVMRCISDNADDSVDFKEFEAEMARRCAAITQHMIENWDNDIIILYTNDVHCGVDDNIGYAGLEFYKHEMLAHTPYVTLVDAGDAVQGEIIGTISNGRYIIDIMNAVGYDVAVPGNHEFDYGMAQFQNFAKNLRCGYVACNFRNLLTGELVFEPYKMISYGDTKVAFVGVCTPDCIISSTPSSFMNDKGEYIYDFDGELTGRKLCASVQSAVDSARANGAGFVILVAHIGENKSLKVWSAPFVAENTRGVDAIIDGHSHEVTPSLIVKNLDGKDVIITQTGTKLKYIGRMTIDASGKLTTELIENVSGRDDKIAGLIQSLRDRYEETLKTHLGYIGFELKAADGKVNGRNKWLLRNAETNLCNFVTDAFLNAAAGSADIALTNAGGIRSDINAGELTYNSALSVFPFGNTLCICDVSGQTILDELELGVSQMPKNFGGLLHVAGLTYTVDKSVPTPIQFDDKLMLTGFANAPRRVRDVKVKGEPLDPNRTYSVISVSYVLLSRGDGHRFEGARLIKPDFITAADAVAHYIKKLEIIPERYRAPQGRMTIVK